jgi:hypothetical protein
MCKGPLPPALATPRSAMSSPAGPRDDRPLRLAAFNQTNIKTEVAGGRPLGGAVCPHRVPNCPPQVIPLQVCRPPQSPLRCSSCARSRDSILSRVVLHPEERLAKRSPCVVTAVGFAAGRVCHTDAMASSSTVGRVRALDRGACSARARRPRAPGGGERVHVRARLGSLPPWIDAQGKSPFVWSVLGGIAVQTEHLRIGTGSWRGRGRRPSRRQPQRGEGSTTSGSRRSPTGSRTGQPKLPPDPPDGRPAMRWPPHVPEPRRARPPR